LKLLFENWRKYLNEAKVTLENWPEGYEVDIIKNPKDGDAYHILLYDKFGEAGYCVVEKVNVERPSSTESMPECDYNLFANLYTMHVGIDEPGSGFGPFLTDLALELAALDNKLIIPAKLVGGTGTEGAKKLYDFYLNNRQDVNIQALDNPCWEFLTNTLIPDDTPESFLYLYNKKPTILNSKLAKKVIKIQ
jgi:hypothetical protein